MKTIELIKKIDRNCYVVSLNGERWHVNWMWLTSEGYKAAPPIVEVGEEKFTPSEIMSAIQKAEHDSRQPKCLDEEPLSELDLARSKIDELETELGHLKMEANADAKLARMDANLTELNKELEADARRPYIVVPSNNELHTGSLVLTYPQDALVPVNLEREITHGEKPTIDSGYSHIVVPPSIILPASHIENNPLGGLMPRLGSVWSGVEGKLTVNGTGNLVAINHRGCGYINTYNVDDFLKLFKPVVEQQYRPIVNGETIEEGDQYLLCGEWITQTSVTGETLNAMVPWRRPLK